MLFVGGVEDSASTEGVYLLLAARDDDTLDYAVFQYQLGTKWDVETAAFSGFKNIQATAGYASHARFKPDGTKVYVLNGTTRVIHQYSCSPAWDFVTATYDSVSFSLASVMDSATAFDFKPDGTRLYVAGGDGTSPGVLQLSMSTAWDISTLTDDDWLVTEDQLSLSPTCVQLGLNGTRLIISASENDESANVIRYDLSTAWSVSTASYVSRFDAAAQIGTTMGGHAISSDGLTMFIADLLDRQIYQYSMSAAWSPASASYSSKVYDATVSGELEWNTEQIYNISVSL